MNRQVLLAIPLLLLISLSVTGIAFAMWKDDVTFKGQITTTNICAELSLPGDVDDCSGKLDYMDDPYAPTWRPWRLDKDIACTTVDLVDSKTMTVRIDNAYPGYATGFDVNVCTCGDLHINLTAIVISINGTRVWVVENDSTSIFTLDLNGDQLPDLAVNHHGWQAFNIQLGGAIPCVDTSWTIVVLQPAPQGLTLTFNITYVVCQFNAINEPINLAR